jgi:hypothetical protein
LRLVEVQLMTVGMPRARFVINEDRRAWIKEMMTFFSSGSSSDEILALDETAIDRLAYR